MKCEVKLERLENGVNWLIINNLILNIDDEERDFLIEHLFKQKPRDKKGRFVKR